MQWIQDPVSEPGCILALGMFDGVHLGHRKLIETNCREAEKRGLTGMVFTFSNHPLGIITPEQIPLQINTTEEKIADLESCGVSAVLLRPFDREFASLSAEAFVERIAITLHPRLFVIGFNYTFGAHGCGRAEDMQRLGKKLGIDTCIVDRVQLAGDTVSSSRIRAALAEGEIDLANTMLGRPYRISGVVERGKHLGRTLGFPTANLQVEPFKFLPKIGVYVASARLDSERIFRAVVNIGMQPSTGNHQLAIEAYILDFDEDIYGKPLSLDLLTYLRPEQKFASLEDLVRQIGMDADTARHYNGNHWAE